ncbi:MAG: sugar phosphate nucleotidyltransferase [Candidatus Gracilibacteria bacterium]|jgi:bifunctional UDP-N-acetylglucosamine pyrophosphorylase/glucosamine-1-phosphate N-acetyltransferase
MKVILLAAGRSKRLKPIEDKNFLKFLGKPLLLHQLEQLSVFFDDFIVIGGAHNLEKIRELLNGWKANKTGGKAKSGKSKLKSTGPKFQFVEQKNLDEGMAGALLSAESLIGKEPILVVSANDVVESQAYKLMLEAIKSVDGANGQAKSAAKKSQKKLVLLAKGVGTSGQLESFLIGKKVESYFPGGYLKTAKDGSIQGIVEKPGAGNEPSDMINLVIHYHKNSEALLKALHSVNSTKDDRYEVAMDHLIKAGHKMKSVPYNGFWQSIKYPWHVLSLMEYFLRTIEGNGERKARGKNKPFILEGKNVEIAKTAIIKGPVFLDDGVKVFENAVISGPAYIGKNSIVATNALVRGSMTGENCIIGFSTEVARSYLGDMVWTHSNYIGDSVIGNNVSFGAGTVTGNLRLDEGNIKVNITDVRIDSGRNKFGLITGNNVRCGINTSFMPGVKIGNNSMIGAGIIVAEDIPDNKLVYGKTELVIKNYTAKIDEKKRAEMKGKL